MLAIDEMKKKILFIMNSMDGGGAERILIDVLRNFDYDCYDVDLILIYGVGIYMKDIPSKVNYLGAIYTEGNYIYEGETLFFRLDRRSESIAIKQLAKDRYDTIVSFIEGYAARFHRYLLEHANQNVSWVHIDLIMNHWSQECYESDKEESEVYVLMDKVVFVSQSAQDAFCRLFHYTKDNLIVIHNPIDKKRILYLSKEKTISKDVFTFVAAGRFCPQKRYDRMLKASKILHDRGCDFRLNILGAGDLESEIKEQIQNLGLEGKVKLHGFVYNPYPYMKDADVFLLSSDAEGFPTVVCEAMTLGVPVIGTNVTGTRDLLGNSEYGLLTDLSPESFAEAMFRLYIDEAERTHYAIKSQERSKTLSMEDAMRRIYSIL